MMKIFTRIVAALVLLAILLGALFYKNIREVLAVREYAASFAPDVIQENFRTMHVRYASQTIEKSDDVFSLNSNLRNDIPQIEYTYGGETKTVSEFINETETTGIIVLDGDNILFERYRLGNTLESHAIQMSVTKSFVSTLVGIALGEGHIESIEDPISKYVSLPEESGYNGVTIKDALEMSSGVRWSEDYGDLNSDIVRSLVAFRTGSLNDFSISIPREKPPGLESRYASIDTQILGMVLERATGIKFSEYFRSRLWEKLGPEANAYLLEDSEGTGVFFGGLNIRLRDMARFGILMLNDGVNYEGDQVIPSGWAKQATTPDATHLMPLRATEQSYPRFGYKYQWWIPNDWDGDDYSAIGIYGQYIYVNPKRNVVIAKTSAYSDYLVDGGWMNVEAMVVFQAIAKHLTPSPETTTEIDPEE